MSTNTLVVITGPTGVGKSDTAVWLARELNAEIISADSRQLYRDIPIGTAAPTAEQMAEVKHHFVGTLSLEEYYSAAQFEDDVMQLLPQLFARSPYVVMCGGSMMYVDAVCKGIDNIPTISDEIRREVVERFERDGAEAMREELRRLDPVYYNQVDLKNHKRVIHAVEICLQAGHPYSELRTNSVKQRPFRIVKIGLNLPREQLFDRINRRVEKMIEAGLVDEARRFYPQRHLNSLNTVGYKELFAWMDGTMDYDTAVARIQKNTRVYAKKQLTWYAKDTDMHWFSPSDHQEILKLVMG
jgi:tRNA dimethylallyltransferase